MTADSWTADSWGRNPLFRVLAFLDNTGEQSFSLADEVDRDGNFLDTVRVFGAGTPAGRILECGLSALRDNIAFLFTDEAERAAFFAVMGASGPAPAPNVCTVSESSTSPTPTATKTAEGVAHGKVTVAVQPADPSVNEAASVAAAANESDGTTGTSRATEPALGSSALLPAATFEDRAVTPWIETVSRPASLKEFTDNFLNGFTLNLLSRLQEVLGLPGTATTDSALVEQFFIDAIDWWMSSRPSASNQRLVRACGVQPPVVEAAVARQQELPHALTDFVIDIVFPAPSSVGAPSDALTTASGVEGDPVSAADPPAVVQDWLVAAYKQNHEAVDVEQESSLSADDDEKDTDDVDAITEPALSRPRTEGPGVDSGLGGWAADEEGAIVLTADNIDRYMSENPSIIPKEILREKRRSWKNPSITAFELEHHYTAAELRTIVKEMAELADGSAAAVALWQTAASNEAGFVVGSLTRDVLRAACRASRKAECIQVLLQLHSLKTSSSKEPIGAAIGGQPQRTAVAGNASALERAPAEHGTKPDGGEDAAHPLNAQPSKNIASACNAGADTPHADDMTTLSSSQLVQRYTLRELQDHLTSCLDEPQPPPTKRKCADLIVSKHRRSTAK